MENLNTLYGSIGNTPLVRLTSIGVENDGVIYGKYEGANPGGSVKDRPALYMLNEAEETGELTPDVEIIEPTSGNTGIGLAMIGRAKGYGVTLVMPGCASLERRRTLEAFGANLVLTPAEKKTDGAIEEAHRRVEENPDRYYMPNQFVNRTNPLAHYETTGPEIYDQTDGDVDVLVAGLGTSGTVMGLARYFKEKSPGVKVVGVEPVKNHGIPGLKNMEEAMIPEIFDPGLLDEKVHVGDEESFTMARRLASEEGLLVGPSSGAAVAGALKVLGEMDSATTVTILPDRGDRYLSTNLFKSACVECPP
ncbi:MAG: PLP-dependent cysteine synthase family protein [Candidatus Acetothermia bacterium]